MDIATLNGLTELSLPDDFEIELERHGLVVRRLRSRGKVVIATFEPLRFRGTTCRRAIATLEDGNKLVVEFGSFTDSYEDVAPIAVLRGSRPAASGVR